MLGYKLFEEFLKYDLPSNMFICGLCPEIGRTASVSIDTLINIMPPILKKSGREIRHAGLPLKIRRGLSLRQSYVLETSKTPIPLRLHSENEAIVLSLPNGYGFGVELLDPNYKR